MDEIEVLGLGRENDECELSLQSVRMATYTYSPTSCHLQQGHELARSSTSTGCASEKGMDMHALRLEHMEKRN